MYNFINDPKTNLIVSIYSRVGKNVLKKYIYSLKGGSEEVKDKLTFVELQEACQESKSNNKKIIIKYIKSEFDINGEDVKKLCSDYQVNIKNNDDEICNFKKIIDVKE